MSLILKALEKAKSMTARKPAAAPPPAALASFRFGRPTRAQKIRKIAIFYVLPGLALAAILALTVNFWLNRMRGPQVTVINNLEPLLPPDAGLETGIVLDPDAPADTTEAASETPPDVAAAPAAEPARRIQGPQLPETPAAPPVQQTAEVRRPAPAASSTTERTEEEQERPAAEPPQTVQTNPAPPPIPPPSAAAAPPPAPPSTPSSTPAPVAITRSPFDLAIFYHRTGDYPKALAEYQKLLDQDPLDKVAHLNIGAVYLAMSKPAEAARSFRSAIFIDDQYDKAHNNLGLALAQTNQTAQAEQSFLRAIQINPKNAEAMTNLANLFKDSGNLEQAKMQYLKALGITSTNPQANYGLAVLYEEQGELGRAIDHYRRFLQNDAGANPDAATDVERKIRDLSARIQFN